ncbi:MAG: carbohydrate ABC transporter permease [Christensenellales bacterium]|jgi:alpha-1,4-digalacturonate transport system permease protein
MSKAQAIKRQKRPKGNFHQTLAPSLFLLPNAAIFVLFIIIPAVQGLYMAFTDWSILGTPKPIGLKNYAKLFNDRVFGITVKNTLVYCFFTVLLITLLAMLLALMLYKNKLKGEKAFRSAFYVPSLMSMITVGIAWRFVLGDEMGIINYLIRLLGGKGIPFLTDTALAMFSIIFVSIWAQAGYYMVIMISGLQAIPYELYEASRIDGANSLQAFFDITLPLLKPTILVVMVLSTIASFKAYELINVMTGGGPGYATKMIVQQIYQVAFTEDRMGYAAAMSTLLMAIIGVFTFIQFRLTGRSEDYE